MILNPKNSLFFGTLCFSLDINSIDDEENNSCYYINTKNIYSIILDEEGLNKGDALYFHIKGKLFLSGLPW